MMQLIRVEELQSKLDRIMSSPILPQNPIPIEIINKSNSSPQQIDLIDRIVNYPIIKDYPKLALKYKIMIEINKVIVFCGQSVTDLELVYEETYKYILLKHSYLTIEEISFAFDKGKMHEFGDWYGIAPLTFAMWIKAYVDNIKFDAAKKASELRKKMLTKETTQEEKDLCRAKWLEMCFAQYKAFCESDKPFMDIANLFYEYLYGLGLIKVTQERSDNLMEDAKRGLIQLETNRIMKNPLERISVKKAIDDILGGEKNQKYRIEAEYKNLLLLDFLRNCKDFDLDLKQLVETTKNDNQCT